jgi:hypothetical protein
VEIAFGLPHVFGTRSNAKANAYALRALLDCLTRIDQAYLLDHPRTPSLHGSGVVYGRTEVWDAIPAIIDRTYGDCKSLTAWRVAELRRAGIQARPVFRFNPRRDGANDYHILVQVIRPTRYSVRDGSGALYEDPSRDLGMSSENLYIRNG